MNKKQYFDYLLPVIEPILNEQGFVFKKSKDAFEKKINDGWIKVNFFFYQSGLDYKSIADLGIRFNSVQEIFVRYRKMESSGYKDTSTVGFSLTDMFHHDHNGFAFRTVGELDDIINEKITPFLKEKVPELCNRYSSIEDVFWYYYTPEKRNDDFMRWKYQGHVLAVILAKLLHRSDFEEVVSWADRGLKKLQQKWPFSNEVDWYEMFFENMVNDLRNIK